MSNSWVCVDASIVVRLVESGTHESPIVELWSGWHEAGRSLMAPTLLYYEVSNALHRYVVHGELRPEEAAEALDAALGLGITLYGDADLHHRALELAERFGLPVTYDSHYLALAERRGAEFWTADRGLAQTVHPTLPWVHLIEG